MSYSGYTERLCINGHYSAVDVWCEKPAICPACSQPFRFMHGVDQTNGYDENHPSSCDAPKVEMGFEDKWHSDHHGNQYATKVRRFAPSGDGIWITINSRQQACPPYPDDLASGMGAGTAETRSGSGLQPASPTAESGDAHNQPGSLK